MFAWLKSLFGINPKTGGAPRSPKWPAARSRWLKDHPTCEVCGGTDSLEVHHKKPFTYFPEFELVESNFMTACEKPSRNCHLNLCHAGDFAGYNPNCVEDAALMLKRHKERKYSR